MPAHTLIAPALLALTPLLLLSVSPRASAAAALGILPLLGGMQLLLMLLPRALRQDVFSIALVAASATTCTIWLLITQQPAAETQLATLLPLVAANAAWWQLARSNEPPQRLFALSLLLAVAPWLVVFLRVGLESLLHWLPAAGPGLARMLRSPPLQLILAAALLALGKHLHNRRNRPETTAA